MLVSGVVGELCGGFIGFVAFFACTFLKKGMRNPI
jgi:hypothetical protein